MHTKNYNTKQNLESQHLDSLFFNNSGDLEPKCSKADENPFETQLANSFVSLEKTIKSYFINYREVMSYLKGDVSNLPSLKMLPRKFSKSLANFILRFIINGRAAENGRGIAEIDTTIRQFQQQAGTGWVQVQAHLRLLIAVSAIIKNKRKHRNVYNINFLILRKLLTDNNYTIYHQDDRADDNFKFTILYKKVRNKKIEQGRHRVKRQFSYKQSYQQKNKKISSSVQNNTNIRKNITHYVRYSNTISLSNKAKEVFKWVNTRKFLTENKSMIIQIILQHSYEQFDAKESEKLYHKFKNLLYNERRSSRKNILVKRLVAYTDAKAKASRELKQRYGNTLQLLEVKDSLEEQLKDRGETILEVRESIISSAKRAKKYQQLISRFGKSWRPKPYQLEWVLSRTWEMVDGGIVNNVNHFINYAKEYLVNLALSEAV